MDRFRRLPVETRHAAEALLRDTELPMAHIAARLGLHDSTVRSWNRAARLRPWSRAGGPDTNPYNWSEGRLRTAARLFARPDIAAADLAEAIGARRREAPAIALTCALAAKRLKPDHAPEQAALEAALRAQIADQIAAFDQGMREGGEGIDSARVLRDLGGLKRLLDDLAGRGGRSGKRGGGTGGDADGESGRKPPRDLVALRADIARRYEAFTGDRLDRPFPGEPAGGKPPRAGG